MNSALAPIIGRSIYPSITAEGRRVPHSGSMLDG
ncbi:hypothetical protein LINGRAHAP2_LOCUS7014 [Linum grandiflorum]